MIFRGEGGNPPSEKMFPWGLILTYSGVNLDQTYTGGSCLLYTSPSPRDVEEARMPSSA